jgi:hypothetical protein
MGWRNIFVTGLRADICTGAGVCASGVFMLGCSCWVFKLGCSSLCVQVQVGALCEFLVFHSLM